MFKVFIYLYIFLESVLCKTWFWLFAQSGEVGAAVTISVGIGSWAMSQSVTTEGEKGSSLHREWGGSSGPPCIFSTHRWMSPMLGKDCHHWVRNSSLPSAHSSCPLWPAAPVGRGSCPFFFFFFFQTASPFSTQIPQSMQRVLQGLEVVPDLPSPKVQPAPCGLIRALQAWCHPGGCYLMVLPTCGVMELQVPLLSRGW